MSEATGKGLMLVEQITVNQVSSRPNVWKEWESYGSVANWSHWMWRASLESRKVTEQRSC